jgi:hypothetical protein
MELNDFFTGHGVKSNFSTSYKQWQKGLVESSVGTVTMLEKTGMAEPGLGGRFWFCAIQNGVICRKVTFKQSIGTAPFEKVYGIRKELFKFRPFGYRAYMHLNKDKRETGRHAPRAVEAVNLGFATDCNTRGYRFYIEETGTILISNQVKLMRTYTLIGIATWFPHLHDITEMDMMSLDTGGYDWIDFTLEIDLSGFERIYSGCASDPYILRSI